MMQISRRQSLSARGLTLVEAVMSMLVVSIMLVSAIRATGGSVLMQYKSAERSTGRLLAAGMMSEILQLPYEDPEITPAFGIEGSEVSTSKAAWDDVDDFNGWTESPPQHKDGSLMANMSGWSRTVLVERVSATTPSQVATSETGAKRITVTVKHNNIPVATRVAIRTKAP